jgi:hypothetical protein
MFLAALRPFPTPSANGVTNSCQTGWVLLRISKTPVASTDATSEQDFLKSTKGIKGQLSLKTWIFAALRRLRAVGKEVVNSTEACGGGREH